jgi:hypothetical protein
VSAELIADNARQWHNTGRLLQLSGLDAHVAAAGLENISHLPPALGADKQPINLVRVSSNISHR